MHEEVAASLPSQRTGTRPSSLPLRVSAYGVVVRSTYIIAEAGVNHNGDLGMAKRVIDVASEAGVDAVKFQTFKAEKLVSLKAPKASYQPRNTGAGESQFEMIRKLELDEQAHVTLIDHCRGR